MADKQGIIKNTKDSKISVTVLKSEALSFKATDELDLGRRLTHRQGAT